MAKMGSDIIQIMRNVTGRIDSSDPLFTDSIMLGYANDFLNLIMPQEVRLFENKTWWLFTLTTASADPLPVDLTNLTDPGGNAFGATTIGPPAYAAGHDLQWFQSPALFFGKWPETQSYLEQRPVDVLYYNNELIFRGPPDQDYEIKISAYKVEPVLASEGELLDNDYFWRYVAYGASLDLFSDYGETDNYAKYYPVFKRYRSLVYSRTNQQLMSQRTFPTF